MNVLISTLSGGERNTGEPHYDSIPWNQLSPTRQATHLMNIRKNINHECLEFTCDEALQLKNLGVFDPYTISTIEGFDQKLLSVRTLSDFYSPGVVIINFLAKYKPDPKQTIPEGILLGTISADKLQDVLDGLLPPWLSPVNL